MRRFSHRLRRRIVFRVLALVACLTVASAWQGVGPDEVQTRFAPYLQKSSASFRAETKLVEVPVIVRDGSRTVDGLRQRDFELFDSGRLRDITAFEAHSGVRSVAPTNSPSPDNPKTDSTKPADKPAQRFVALVFDDESMGFDNFTYDGLVRTAEAGSKFVQEGLAANDRAVVFSLSQGPVSPLTSDTAKLVAAIQGLRNHPRLPRPDPLLGFVTPYDAYAGSQLNSNAPMPAPQQRSGGGRSPKAPPGAGSGAQARQLWIQVESNSRRLLGMLEEIVDFMGTLPGQRMVLVASPGFMTQTLVADRERVIEHALRAGVVVNALDMSGLYGGPPIAALPGAVAIHLERIASIAQASANGVLETLAASTGGRFFHNNNDLLQGFRDLAAPENSYLLGFVPDGAQDGRYHKLRVRQTVTDRYDVQARPGYYATDPDKASTPREREIDEAMMASDAKSGIPASVTVVKDMVKGLPAVWAVAHLDVAKMRFEREDGRRVQEVSIVAALFDVNGNLVAGKEGSVSFALKEPSYQALSKEGVNCTLTLVVGPGSYRLRTVVTYAGGGPLTTANHYVDLP